MHREPELHVSGARTAAPLTNAGAWLLLLLAVGAIMGLATSPAAAQNITLSQVANIAVLDWNGQSLEGNSNPSGFTRFKNELVFSAADYFGDVEIYAYDGHAVRRLANINPTGSSSPSGFIRYHNKVIFNADDGTSGRELWSYDGHRVTRVADINPTSVLQCTPRPPDPRNPRGGGGQDCVLVPQSSNPSRFIVFGNELVFAANDGVSGNELWVYDGRHIRQLADIRLGSGAGLESSWGRCVFGQDLFFTANDGVTGAELWAYDGHDVRQVADIRLGSLGSAPFSFYAFGDELLFYANDGISGQELWAWDGQNVRQLADIQPGPGGSTGITIIGHVFGGEFVFNARNTATGDELWCYDGTSVRQIADLVPGRTGSSPGAFTEFRGELMFTAGSTRRELWAYDRQAVRQVLPSGPFSPLNMTVFGNLLVFAGNDMVKGSELWTYDGETAVCVADLFPGFFGSNPTGLMVFGNQLIFNADDGATGRELWALTRGASQQ